MWAVSESQVSVQTSPRPAQLSGPTTVGWLQLVSFRVALPFDAKSVRMQSWRNVGEKNNNHGEEEEEIVLIGLLFCVDPKDIVTPFTVSSV